MTACHPVEAVEAEAVPPEAHRRGSDAETVEANDAKNAAGRAESGPANAPHAQRLTPGATGTATDARARGSTSAAADPGRAVPARASASGPGKADALEAGDGDRVPFVAVEVEAGAEG